MKKQVPTSDRVARTIRGTPELIAELDLVASQLGLSFNDVAVSILTEALAKREGDEAVRDMVDAASRIALPVLRVAEASTPALSTNARLLARRAVLKTALDDACEKMLVPERRSQVSVALWSIAKEITSDLQLVGPPWDYVRELGVNSPPPSAAQVDALASAIADLKSRPLSDGDRSRVETLDAYLGLAQREHEQEWAQLKARAQSELDAAMLSLQAPKAVEGHA